MKKKISALIFCLIIILSFFPVISFAEQAPDIQAAQAVIMDAKTGQVIYQKNMNERAYPASITKIMTTLLAVENASLTDVLTATQTAVGNIAVPRDTSHIMLVDGEQMPLESLLYATMLPSANDAANVVAEYIGGSLSGFAKMMNSRAATIGCTNTHFNNANGLPDQNHYITAYDMALITKTALQNETFREFFSAVTYSAEATNKNTGRSGATSHKMLKAGEYYYESATGGKTGWTEAAKYTVVTSAKRGDIELICVLLGCEAGDQRFSETIKLFDYVFANYSYTTISKTDVGTYSADVIKDEYKVSVATYTLDSDLKFLLQNGSVKKDITISSSVAKKYNEDPGVEFITLTAVGTEIGEYPLSLSLQTLDEPVFVGKEITYDSSGGFWNVIVKILVVIGIIILAAAVLFIIVIVYAIIERKKRMERRRHKKLQRQQPNTQNNFYFDEKDF